MENHKVTIGQGSCGDQLLAPQKVEEAFKDQIVKRV